MKRMYHPKGGWHLAMNPVEESQLRSLGWVDDKPEFSPEYVAPNAGPQGGAAPPSSTLPHAPADPAPSEDTQAKRGPGRPRKLFS